MGNFRAPAPAVAPSKTQLLSAEAPGSSSGSLVKRKMKSAGKSR